jgi:hypothetical protein
VVVSPLENTRTVPVDPLGSIFFRFEYTYHLHVIIKEQTLGSRGGSGSEMQGRARNVVGTGQRGRRAGDGHQTRAGQPSGRPGRRACASVDVCRPYQAPFPKKVIARLFPCQVRHARLTALAASPACHARGVPARRVAAANGRADRAIRRATGQAKLTSGCNPYRALLWWEDRASSA